MISLENRIGILHLSDIHISKGSEDKIRQLVECLNVDLDELQNSQNIDIP